MGQIEKPHPLVLRKQLDAPPLKRRSREERRTEFDEQTFYLKCAQRGLDPNDVMARYLAIDPDERDLDEKEKLQLAHSQAQMATRLLDKFVPSKKPIDSLAADKDKKLVITWKAPDDSRD
jgi:hypothetical protein